MGTLTHNPHTYCLQMLHSAWHAVTPPLTIVLLLDAKLQDLAMHMRAVAAVEYLGSQLMSLNVESVYENVYFRTSLAQKEHVNWHTHSPVTNPVCVCVSCVCMQCVCVVVSPWGSMKLLPFTVDIRT